MGDGGGSVQTSGPTGGTKQEPPAQPMSKRKKWRLKWQARRLLRRQSGGAERMEQASNGPGGPETAKEISSCAEGNVTEKKRSAKKQKDRNLAPGGMVGEGTSDQIDKPKQRHVGTSKQGHASARSKNMNGSSKSYTKKQKITLSSAGHLSTSEGMAIGTTLSLGLKRQSSKPHPPITRSKKSNGGVGIGNDSSGSSSKVSGLRT